MVTVTTTGREYIAKFFNNAESTAIINKIRVGSSRQAEAITDTDLVSKYTDGGFQEATASTIEYIDTPAHPRSLHLQKTFTNGSTESRTVNECGAFTSGGVCVLRHVYSPFEFYNEGVILPGGTVTVDIYISLETADINYSTENEMRVYINLEYECTIAVNAVVTGDNSPPSGYPCERGKVCFNGVVLPNASPSPQTVHASGGRVWEFGCVSDDWDHIQQIIARSTIVSTGVDIYGNQYAVGLKRYGTLKIWNKITQTHDSYNNCLISGPIKVTPFGEWWFFTVTVIGE